MKLSGVFLFSLIFIVSCRTGTTGQTNYYFAFESGSDSGNGSVKKPYKTFTKLESLSLNPGDSVFFKKGEQIRTPEDKNLNISWSGSPDQYLYFGVYGDDEKRPKIIGSYQIIGWKNEGNNIWSAPLKVNPRSIGYGADIFCLRGGDVFWAINRDYNNGLSELKYDRDWSWNNNIIYMYSTSDPSIRFDAVESPITKSPISLGRQEYLHIDSLEVAYFVSRGIGETYKSANVSGLRITNCHIHHSGYQNSATGYGLDIYHSNVYIANNDIHNNGRRNISLTSYKTSPKMYIKNIIIEKNYLHNGWHTTGVDINTIGSHEYDSIIIRNNLFQDSFDFNLTSESYNEPMTSNQIFIAHQGTDSRIRNIYIYNNIFCGHTGNGVLIGGGNKVEGVHVINNTFYGYNRTLTGFYGFFVASKAENLEVLNNIFYGTGTPEQDKDLYTVSINDTATLAATTMNYNLHYQENPNERFFMLQNIEGVKKYYPFRMRNWLNFQTTFNNLENNGFGAINPLFIAPESGNFKLQSESICKNSGTPIIWLRYDYYGMIRDLNNPSIGAIE